MDLVIFFITIPWSSHRCRHPTVYKGSDILATFKEKHKVQLFSHQQQWSTAEAPTVTELMFLLKTYFISMDKPKVQLIS